MPTLLSVSAQNPKVKHPLEVLEFGVDFTSLLDAGETLTGTPAVTGGVDLTLGAATVNTTSFQDDAEEGGFTVAIGCGVQFHISGGTAGQTYNLVVACPTSQGLTRVVVCVLYVLAA